MDTSAATDYLPVDLLGIGSTPLLLFVLASVLVIAGFVAASLMLFYFRISIGKGATVLGASLLGAVVLSTFGFFGYQQVASSNLAANVVTKYPELKLQSPDEVIKDYVRLSAANDNAPLEVSVLHKEETIKYRVDLSKGGSEPTLSPIDGSESPNPIVFLRPATSGGPTAR